MKDKDKKVEPHLPNWLYSNAINLAYLEEEMLRQFPPTNLSRVFNELIKRSRHYSTLHIYYRFRKEGQKT